MELVEHVESNGRTIAPSPRRTADLDRRATAALHQIAPSLGRPPTLLSAGLTAIGDMFGPVGVATADRDARIPRLLTRLEEANTGLAHWVDANPENDLGGLGQAVSTAMKRVTDSGRMVLESTRSALTDTQVLLRWWTREPGAISERAARCDWLLDGWERIGLLWLAAGTRASRRAALLEMAPLIPVLPKEVTDWTDTPIAAEAMTQVTRVISHEDAWRTGGSAFALIGRNEKLLAMSAWSGPPPAVFADGPQAS